MPKLKQKHIQVLKQCDNRKHQLIIVWTNRQMQLDEYFALFKPHFLKYAGCHNWLEISNQDQLMLGKPTRVGEVVLKQSNSDLELQEKFKIFFFLIL